MRVIGALLLFLPSSARWSLIDDADAFIEPASWHAQIQALNASNDRFVRD
jgi:hypothetical protein